MSIYFQHVGEKGGSRDFPKTIGTRQSGLKFFSLKDFPEFKEQVEPLAKDIISRDSLEQFQVWGIPSGAKNVLRNLKEGDWLLLIESDGPGGQFYYGGKVLYRSKREYHDISRRLWGEDRFPLILFLDGQLTNFPWERFREAFGYASNWRLSGNTYRLLENRISNSPFLSIENIIETVIGISSPESQESFVTDLMDQVELMIDSLEGRRLLREHLIRERDQTLIRKFKQRLVKFNCSVCNFDFQNMYGEIGRNFIEAHHVNPLSNRSDEMPTSLADLIQVCSNCHRMLHRKAPPFTKDDMKNIIIDVFDRKSIK